MRDDTGLLRLPPGEVQDPLPGPVLHEVAAAARLSRLQIPASGRVRLVVEPEIGLTKIGVKCAARQIGLPWVLR